MSRIYGGKGVKCNDFRNVRGDAEGAKHVLNMMKIGNSDAETLIEMFSAESLLLFSSVLCSFNFVRESG